MRSIPRFVVTLLVIGLCASACSLPEGGGTAPGTNQATPTPTPTPILGIAGPGEEPPEVSPCQGLSGEVEIRILVGPADIVGLDPTAIGTVPFSVISDSEPYLIEGSGQIDYYDMMAENWGTYEVTMDLMFVINGECVVLDGEPYLDMHINMAGNQVFIVTVEGSSQPYPWTGEMTFDVYLPAVSGESASGEGWEFILTVNR